MSDIHENPRYTCYKLLYDICLSGRKGLPLSIAKAKTVVALLEEYQEVISLKGMTLDKIKSIHSYEWTDGHDKSMDEAINEIAQCCFTDLSTQVRNAKAQGLIIDWVMFSSWQDNSAPLVRVLKVEPLPGGTTMITLVTDHEQKVESLFDHSPLKPFVVGSWEKKHKK